MAEPFRVNVYLWPGDSVSVTKGDSNYPSPYIEYEGMTDYKLGAQQSAVPHEGDILERQGDPRWMTH